MGETRDTQAQTAVNPNIQRSINKHVECGLGRFFNRRRAQGDAERVQTHLRALRHSVNTAENMLEVRKGKKQTSGQALH